LRGVGVARYSEKRLIVNAPPFRTIAGVSALVAAAFVVGASLAVLPLLVSVGLIAAAVFVLVLTVVRSAYAPAADARELSLERFEDTCSSLPGRRDRRIHERRQLR